MPACNSSLRPLSSVTRSDFACAISISHANYVFGAAKQRPPILDTFGSFVSPTKGSSSLQCATPESNDAPPAQHPQHRAHHSHCNRCRRRLAVGHATVPYGATAAAHKAEGCARHILLIATTSNWRYGLCWPEGMAKLHSSHTTTQYYGNGQA